MGVTKRDDGRQGILVYMRWREIPDIQSSVFFKIRQEEGEYYGHDEHMPEEMIDRYNRTNQFDPGYPN